MRDARFRSGRDSSCAHSRHRPTNPRILVHFRSHRIVSALTLIFALGSLPAVALTDAANAEEPAVAAQTPPASTRAADDVALAPARVTPEVKLEFRGYDPDNGAQFHATVTPKPTAATIGYSVLEIQIDQVGILTLSSMDENGVADGSVRLDPGHYTGRAIIPMSVQFNEAKSETVSFDVPEPPKRTATKLTLTAPKNPYGNVKYPYTVKVAPSQGSTARVDLSQYDNVGQLQYIGFGYLKNGEVTINAAAMPGQRRIVAEFTGDDTYAVSGAAVDIFFPIAPTAAADPPAAPLPSAAPAATDPSTAGRSIAGSTATTATGELAYTGSNPWPGAVLATALLAAGVALRLLVRRRQH